MRDEVRNISLQSTRPSGQDYEWADSTRRTIPPEIFYVLSLSPRRSQHDADEMVLDFLPRNVFPNRTRDTLYGILSMTRSERRLLLVAFYDFDFDDFLQHLMGICGRQGMQYYIYCGRATLRETLPVSRSWRQTRQLHLFSLNVQIYLL